ncbi:hypothetical protein ACG7TL_001456 [Trametes sanguinea]
MPVADPNSVGELELAVEGASFSASIKLGELLALISSLFSHSPLHIATMVARIATSFVALIAASIVGATAVPRNGGSDCNTGPIQCCNQLQKSNDPLSVVTTFIGIGCSPISVIGGAVGAKCTQDPVCCQNNNVGGLISLGCVPVIL